MGHNEVPVSAHRCEIMKRHPSGWVTIRLLDAPLTNTRVMFHEHVVDIVPVLHETKKMPERISFLAKPHQPSSWSRS